MARHADPVPSEIEETPLGDSNSNELNARSCNFFQIRNHFEKMHSKPTPKRSRKQFKPSPLSLPQGKVSSSSVPALSLYSQFKNHFTKRQFATLETSFTTADSNQDGYLEAKDIQRFLDEYEQSISLCQADFMVSAGDENEDGKLSLREFLQLCIPASEELYSEQADRMNGSLTGEDFMREILRRVCRRVTPAGNINVKDSLEYFERKMTGGFKGEQTQSDAKKKMWQVDKFEKK